MKRTYIQPKIEMFKVETVSFVCGSQDITSNLDIDYGGVDEEGELEADSRRHRHDVWEEELDEEEEYE